MVYTEYTHLFKNKTFYYCTFGYKREIFISFSTLVNLFFTLEISLIACYTRVYVYLSSKNCFCLSAFHLNLI